ncbi:hypothetical protein QC763_105270 [Podospora pseudopauciseta]|uniref:Allergen Asp f 4 n=1 Tax=Podospora pseudopauciseta TaxID=2093780 RepID=A0ABR0HXR7_9PEZI|nr:hypothetical protein QC763_105270 [Podospora pseudopauciseta]
MQLSHLLLLAGALTATAHPSGHAHLHRSIHEKREGGITFLKAVHKSLPEPTETAPEPAPEPPKASIAAVEPSPSPKPKPEPAPAPAPAKEESEDSNDSDSEDGYKPFCGSSKRKAKRVTWEQIHYTGNTGTANGCPWNSNLQVVSTKASKQYKYVQNYKNVGKVPYEVICFNKIGADGGVTGSFKVEGQNQLVFKLQPGETKSVVADSNTQGVCAFAPNSVPTTSHGQYAGNWAEFDFENTSNKGWSGADCSSLVAQAYNMDFPGCRMSQGGVDSSIYPDGTAENAYIRGMEAEDGIGLNIEPGPTVIEVLCGLEKGM